MPPKKSIWYPSENVDAQAAHVGWGAFFAFAGSTIWGWPVGLAILLGFATLKEFAFDIIVEEDTWSDSLMDWTFYMVGGVVGYGFFYGQPWIQ